MDDLRVDGVVHRFLELLVIERAEAGPRIREIELVPEGRHQVFRGLHVPEQH